MVPELRDQFNAAFSFQRYHDFIEDLSSATGRSLDFRVSETPLFLSAPLTARLEEAAYSIASQIQSPDVLDLLDDAVPERMRVPNENPHSSFLQIDFAIVRDFASGEYMPQLIELQGFPSLYGFQFVLDETIRRHFDIPEGLTPYFSRLDSGEYLARLKRRVLAHSAPDNVVLLEVEPHTQKTRIDYFCTQRLLGIPTVCLSQLTHHGNQLFYRDSGGHEILIERIYNRIIFEELFQKSIRADLLFYADLDVSWVGHPNWFFKLSKFVLPYLKGPYCSPCFRLDELTQYPADLENYILKPLFSFAGSGVQLDVTAALLDTIEDKSNYILQKKVEYAPLIRTPDGYSKVEVRMMFIWEDRPLLVNNLVRMSQGRMMGVAFNRDRTWVGSSIAYHY